MNSDDSEDLDDSDFLELGLGQQPLARLTSMVNQFMIRGTHTPMDWLLDLRAYGMNIARNTTSIGQMDWNEDRILYGNLEFSMSDFRGFIHDLITFTRTLLFEDLLFQNISTLSTQKILEISWSDIRDNSLNSSPFSNFLLNSRTNFGVDESTRWLWNRIVNDSTLKNRFRKSNTQWRVKRLQRYFLTISEFLEKLLILFHIIGGQPARAPEILSIRVSNSVNSGVRNIFYENELICFVTFYYKGYAIQNSTKIIHRYIPREVGELLVYYQWLILPFQSRIALSVFENSTTEYLFQKFSEQSNRSQQVTSDQFRLIFRRETMLGLGVAINPSQYRHIAIGISRRYFDKSHRFERDDDINSDSKNNINYEDDVIDLQAGHKSNIAGLIYGRGIMKRSGEVQSLKNKFRETSTISQ